MIKLGRNYDSFQSANGTPFGARPERGAVALLTLAQAPDAAAATESEPGP